MPHGTIEVSRPSEVQQHQWVFGVGTGVYVDTTVLREGGFRQRHTHTYTYSTHNRHVHITISECKHTTRNECRHRQEEHIPVCGLKEVVTSNYKYLR